MTNLSQFRAVLTKSRLGSKGSTKFLPQIRRNHDDEKTQKVVEKIEDLVEPTTCCMSGCANCVWIEYAENLSRLLKNSDQSVQKIVMEKVQDPNMRSFLMMELKLRNLK